MRLDELPRSDNVEDRRGDASGGFPMGRTGGIGIGTIILLGLIGWGHQSALLDRRGGDFVGPGWLAAAVTTRPGQCENRSSTRSNG